jgi:hypothetical protein
MLEVSGLYMPTGELRGEPGHFELQHYKFEGLVPMPVSRDTFLLFGGHAGARIYDFSSHVEGADDDILYNAGLRLGAGRFVNDDFVLQGYWQPSLYSDLDGTLNSRDWKLWYGTGLAVYRARADLFLKGGFILTDSVDTGAVPAAGVSWLIAPGWRFDLLVPRNLELSYAPHASWNLHAGIEFETEEFHLRGPPEEGKRERDVHVRDLRAYLGALYRLGRHASLFARVGSTIGAYYDWSTSGKPDYDGTLEPGIFFQAGAGWSF